jgi:hypothetical protein
MRKPEKFHFGEGQNFHSSPHIIRIIQPRRIKLSRRVARMGGTRNACNILVLKREGERPIGRARRRLEGNIKMFLEEEM